MFSTPYGDLVAWVIGKPKLGRGKNETDPPDIVFDSLRGPAAIRKEKEDVMGRRNTMLNVMWDLQDPLSSLRDQRGIETLEWILIGGIVTGVGPPPTVYSFRTAWTM